MIKFGTGGFRAIIGEDFTKANIQKTAQALCEIIRKTKESKPVVIGYDRRFMSDQAAVWFAEVLAANKVKVCLFTHPIPTPAVMLGTMDMDNEFGVMITASHNPYMYNGIKLFTKGGKDADVTFTQRLESIIKRILKVKTISIEEARTQGLVEDYDNIKRYVKNIQRFVSKDIKNNKLKVLFNPMHGVTNECGEMLLKAFKIKKYDIINANEDPYFEHKLPAPNDATLEDFKKQVVKGKYSVGVACDGDGDRLGIIDELGNYHTANTIMAVIYYYLIKYRGMEGDIVKNLSTSIILDKLADKFGYTCQEVPVGFKWTSAKMAETDALLGGESSGGLTMRDYIPGKDSWFAISLVLDAMANIKKPLSEIVKDVYEFAEYDYHCMETAVKVKHMDRIKNLFAKRNVEFTYAPVAFSSSDGYKFVFEDGSWVLVRASGTEPILRLSMEFPAEEDCVRNMELLKETIEKADK